LIYPEKKEALQRELKGWQNRLGAQMPALAE
jgi:hypothetical protein